MSLVGKSLEDLRRQVLCKNFSKSTAMKISLQALEAISDLHSVGFLHRDIKPANFASSLSDELQLIYVLDFGIARNPKETTTRLISAGRHFSVVPKDLYSIVLYVGQLKYETEPDYTYIRNYLLTTAKQTKIDVEKKFDWTGKVSQAAKRKKKEQKQESSSSEDNQHTGSDDESDSEVVSSTEKIKNCGNSNQTYFCESKN
ncbi:hypothetical protein WR25_15007 [Diploscapter pachys]|uniref:Protein kinase domain-containing protein n=1 Tax=Diploscapter pachys TaxID=2018661 RepID=A0A2A2JS59_9BILA|nr:hypothetical protein WR25_15007 [Diploscapter pachys]